MKFVGFDITHGDTIRRIVAAFPNDIVHADMAAGVEHALRLSWPRAKFVKAVTAGELTVKAMFAGGDSASLNLGPDKHDLPSFNGADYAGHIRSTE